MSTDTSTRIPEAALKQARDAVGTGPIPARTALRKILGVGWQTATDIHDRLTSEREQHQSERKRGLRAAMARVQARGPRPRHLRLPSRPRLAPAPEPATMPTLAPTPVEPETVQKIKVADPVPAAPTPVRTWPVLGLILPAFVAIWSGWVDLGRLTGFGVVRPFPGIPGADRIQINTAITLPVGLETYAAFALYVWLSGRIHGRALTFARWSAIGSLALGAAGQVAYHLMVAAGWTSAPWWITTIVSCIPVAVLGMGAALAHLVRSPA
ncbi:ABC transporter permease [Actinoplanes italicus]|nr:ABC transporter permease [Actinoplanes italicus]